MLVDGEAPDDETRNEFYNVIQSETNRLSRLIDNMLNINRIESGMVKIHREAFALPTVIKAVADVMQPQARAKQLTLTDKPSPLYYQVHADRDMIYQAALNLVGNAVKYTPEGGSVTLETEVDEYAHQVVVKVTDTGPGIPDEAIPHLFDKFYRVDGHKKLAKGTGLGLNLVKHIVETIHGGAVSVSSEVGVGSTFSFSLPIADDAE
jgi:two-component system phosphate regulon sensor histidine kinase PhoR